MSLRHVAQLFAVRMALAGGRTREPESERSLLVRARRGEAAAFRVLFERHAPAVWRFARDLFQDEAAADEATQETFVRAHGKLASLRDDTRLSSWLLGIVRHLHLESLRGRPTHLDVADEEHEVLLEAALPSPTPEALLLDRELEGLLSEALGSLREERRAALLLRIDHGLGYEDIAQVMGWTLPKVKNEIHRARMQLRERLADHVESTGGRS
ncbi:RNA polymerase sigma factor [Archangium primigenium]|uniref:RNA polymerase sigma factor n=1 Tax=[Archangium] primigenium TaxID=2792470 RepID=UPI0019563375|nr:sigma-70 family RNA polymerase sigma factor [Archangium primigenium]MBM7112202.1 sigma-70 family RNA polymerase sigma factor [Archangium primigenium]